MKPKPLYNATCERLQELAERHGIGSAGDWLDVAVCEFVDQQAKRIVELEAENAVLRQQVLTEGLKEQRKA